MSVTKDEVKYIAELAKLYFSDEELEQMQGEMDNLVAFAHRLSSLDTGELEPLSHVQGSENVFGEDKPHGGKNLGELLQNAPESVDDYFVVPKVVD
jgi:aspartyl-tRNA(Asn)/glutamyl-tRNA(Gln) amidotransferase subunit C